MHLSLDHTCIVGYPNIAFNVGIIFKLILKINK